jgi:hypothetical protein
MCEKFLLVNLMESSYIEELCVDDDLKKYDGMEGIGFILIRRGTGGGSLST